MNIFFLTIISLLIAVPPSFADLTDIIAINTIDQVIINKDDFKNLTINQTSANKSTVTLTNQTVVGNSSVLIESTNINNSSDIGNVRIRDHDGINIGDGINAVNIENSSTTKDSSAVEQKSNNTVQQEKRQILF